MKFLGDEFDVTQKESILYEGCGLELIYLDRNSHPLRTNMICLHIQCSFRKLKYKFRFICPEIQALKGIDGPSSFDMTRTVQNYNIQSLPALKQPVLKQGQASSAPLQAGGQLTASHLLLSGTAQLLQNFILSFERFRFLYENCTNWLDYKDDGHVTIDDFYDGRKVWLNHGKTLQAKIKRNMVKIF